MTSDKYLLAMVYVNDTYYVIAGNDGSLNDFGSRDAALGFFTDAYDRAHLRSDQGMGSAIISNVTSAPKVIEADLELLTTKLFDEKKGIKQARLGANLGFKRGLACNRPIAMVKKVYESGESPALASDEIQDMI